MQTPSPTVRAPKRRLIITDNNNDKRQPLVASSAAAKENISPEAQICPAKHPAIDSRRTSHKGNGSKSPTATATRLTKPAVDCLTERLASLTLAIEDRRLSQLDRQLEIARLATQQSFNKLELERLRRQGSQDLLTGSASVCNQNGPTEPEHSNPTDLIEF